MIAAFSVQLPCVWDIFLVPRELAVLEIPKLNLQFGTNREPGQQGHRQLSGGEGGRVSLHRVFNVSHLQHGSVLPRLRVQHRVGHLAPVKVQFHHGGLRGFTRLLYPVLLRLLCLHLAFDDAVGDPSQDLSQRLVLVPKHVLVAAVQGEGDSEFRLPREAPHHGRLHPVEEAAGSGQSPL